MSRRRSIAITTLVVLAVAAGSAAVLTDDRETVPPPSLDDDDAAIVTQAVQHLHTADYRATVEFEVINESAGTVARTERTAVRVQNSEQRASAHDPDGDGREQYVNSAVWWTRVEGGEWSKSRTTGWNETDVNPLRRPERIAETDLERVDRDAGADVAVFRLSDAESVDAVYDSHPVYENATLEFSIDRESGRLVAVTLRTTPSETDLVHRHRIRFEDHGDVVVERPDDLEFDGEEWLLKRYYAVR